jgi:hypothetical protein
MELVGFRRAYLSTADPDFAYALAVIVNDSQSILMSKL